MFSPLRITHFIMRWFSVLPSNGLLPKSIARLVHLLDFSVFHPINRILVQINLSFHENPPTLSFFLKLCENSPGISNCVCFLLRYRTRYTYSSFVPPISFLRPHFFFKARHFTFVYNAANLDRKSTRLNSSHVSIS